jgi:hypothetical protein
VRFADRSCPPVCLPKPPAIIRGDAAPARPPLQAIDPPLFVNASGFADKDPADHVAKPRLFPADDPWEKAAAP